MDKKTQIEFNKLYILLFTKLLMDKKQLTNLAKKIKVNIEYKFFIASGLIIDIKELDLIELYQKQSNIYYLLLTEENLTKKQKINFIINEVKNFINEIKENNLFIITKI